MKRPFSWRWQAGILPTFAQREFQLSRFTFRATDNLAQELASFQKPPNTLSFPGIVLLYDGQPCAAIGCSHEPGGTLVISQPVVLIDASEQVRSLLIQQLIQQMGRRAIDDGLKRLHFLELQSGQEALLLTILVEQGFVFTSEIIQRELLITIDHDEIQTEPHELTFEVHDLTSVNPAFDRELQRTLDAILNSSLDLSGELPPCASDLLTKWRQLRAPFVVARAESEIVGVMCCSTCTTASTFERDVCIEYIGVAPSFRRSRVATSMIHRIPALMHKSAHDMARGGPVRTTRIQTYSDAANAPATQMYEHCGFITMATMRLWCCDLKLPE